MGLPLLDTNVLLRHFTADHATQSPHATALIERIAEGELQVRLSDQVVFETAFTLHKLYRVPRQDVVDALKGVLELDGMVLPGKEQWPRVFEIFVSSPQLSFVDSYHVVFMEQNDLTEVMSWDKGFDRVPGITRIEP